MSTFNHTATGGENAIEGVASSGRGIVGFSNGNYGVSGDSQTFAGVRGTSDFSRGVEGWSRESEGVFGITGLQGFAGGVAGVWGLAGSHTRPGVVGTASSGSAAGVEGTNDDHGPGVSGTTLDGIGVLGGSYGASEQGVGVYASSEAGTALLAIGRRAALFAGEVVVSGRLGANEVEVSDLDAFNTVTHTLTVTGIKSAAVPHPDGMHRRLYCMESPECWFEDFGEASLKNGVARVKLDREFAALVKTGRYHVFLSSYDAVQLYVSKRSSKGFEIRAVPGARGRVRQTARCAYRIVARRKDVEAPRLAKVKIPVRRKSPPVSKFLKSPLRLSKRARDQFAALQKAHRKRLREVKRFSANGSIREGK